MKFLASARERERERRRVNEEGSKKRLERNVRVIAQSVALQRATPSLRIKFHPHSVVGTDDIRARNGRECNSNKSRVPVYSPRTC